MLLNAEKGSCLHDVDSDEEHTFSRDSFSTVNKSPYVDLIKPNQRPDALGLLLPRHGTEMHCLINGADEYQKSILSGSDRSNEPLEEAHLESDSDQASVTSLSEFLISDQSSIAINRSVPFGSVAANHYDGLSVEDNFNDHSISSFSSEPFGTY